MTRTKPLQGRSRERVEQILLAAAELIDESGSADALTTTAVAIRSDMSVATVYRYFDDRNAIIVALLDREFEKLLRTVMGELRTRAEVSVAELIALIILVHLDYFRSNRTAVPLWYATRGALLVEQHVARQFSALANWISVTSMDSGLIRTDAPAWGAEPLVWMCDQVFHFVFRLQRDDGEQERIIGLVQQMLTDQITQFATEAGRDGMSAVEFVNVAERTLSRIVESGQLEPQQ